MRPERSGWRIRSAASRPASRRTCASGKSRACRSLATGSACRDRNAASSVDRMRNAAAALVAIICWAGLAIQFNATFASQHHVVPTLWVLLRFFTVITNLAVAIVMTWVATGGRTTPLLLGWITISIILVGVVYMTLLRGLVELIGGALLADSLL